VTSSDLLTREDMRVTSHGHAPLGSYELTLLVVKTS
jgi:hypothetical protein